jgi:hypothetical protein
MRERGNFLTEAEDEARPCAEKKKGALKLEV